ncbi:hypothetical protein DFH09DRAFT_1090989 [Mycena vulgaris]|nr:hypothetical protein DFH09DRAFT_1090989 [Mycena vulgaris]
MPPACSFVWPTPLSPLSGADAILVTSIPLDVAADTLPVHPCAHTQYGSVLMDPECIEHDPGTGTPVIVVCISVKRLPAWSITNHNYYLGPVPPELKGLTVVEEVMIALCRVKCRIQLRDDQSDTSLNIPQSGVAERAYHHISATAVCHFEKSTTFHRGYCHTYCLQPMSVPRARIENFLFWDVSKEFPISQSVLHRFT